MRTERGQAISTTWQTFWSRVNPSLGIVSEFPIKKKTHRTKPRNYYNRKKRIDYLHGMPVCRPQTACVPRNKEIRRKTPAQKENRPFGTILERGWNGEFRSATRRFPDIFDGSKIKQEKAAGLRFPAAAHIGRQCRPKNGVVTPLFRGFHIRTN